MDEPFKSNRYESNVEALLVSAITTIPNKDSFEAGVAMTILWLQGKADKPLPRPIQQEK